MAGRRSVGVVITAPSVRQRGRGVSPTTVVRRGEGGVPSVVPPSLPPEAQRFTPQPLSLRRRPIVLALTLSGWTPEQIATKLHVTAESIRQTQYLLRKQGALNEEVALLLDKECVPRAVENLRTLLAAGDKDATFETLKGRGAFRKDVHVDAQTQHTEFKITFEVPADGGRTRVNPAQIVAAPHGD